MRHEFVLPWLVRDHYVPGLCAIIMSLVESPG
ncbi:Uncharacterised protein [Shigella flexneri 2a]|nr:Uncharacterised protein [Shigella flexneri 2a]